MTDMNSTEEYEAPTIKAVGTLHDLTKSANALNSDVLPFQANTAFPPPS